MRRYVLYTSISTNHIDKSLSNIERWKEYTEVECVKLIQNNRESLQVLGYIKRLKDVKVINTRGVDEDSRSSDNPKELPSLKELLASMRRESLRYNDDTQHIYLNSDIIIIDRDFFKDLGPAGRYIALLHRRDVSISKNGIEDKGFYIHGVDGFCVSSLMLESVQYGSSDLFYLGLPGWDQYLPLLCWLNGWQQRFIASQFAFHKIHNTSNPGRYSHFANRLIALYICEYYMNMRSRYVRQIVRVTSWIRGNDWMTSIGHKLVVFPALWSLGWRIQRKSHRSTDKEIWQFKRH